MDGQTWWCSASQLDEEQKRVMELPVEGSYLLRGPPGSGKTNLLLMRASYLALSHKNVCVVVFNRTLAEFLRSGATRYNFAPDDVVTYTQLVYRLAKEADIHIEQESSFAALRTRSLSILEIILKARKEPMYDVLLVDEAQDYRLEELQALRKLSNDVFLAADVRQRIYKDSNNVTGGVADLVDKELELSFHYRNAPAICELADRIGDGFSSKHGYVRIAPGCRYPLDGPREEVRIVAAPFSEQATTIAARLEVQLRAFRGELLGVFAAKAADVEKLEMALRSAGLGDQLTVDRHEGRIRMDANKPIFVSTVHAAKGLEFRAVHFAAADTIRNLGENQKRVAFTGVTRAKTSLTIYHERPLPGFFDKAVDPNRQRASSGKSWKEVFNGT